jgi:hypothetical protein
MQFVQSPASVSIVAECQRFFSTHGVG